MFIRKGGTLALKTGWSPVDTSINFTILSLIKPKPPFSSRCGRRKSSYTDLDTEFWFPILISKEEVDLSIPPAARYLSCRTKKHGCLKEKSLSLNRNILKLYQLYWTRQTVKWAGLLRPHNIHSEDITANASIPIELIALSKGIRLPNILNDLFFFLKNWSSTQISSYS